MRVTIAQRRGNGDVVTTLIEPHLSQYPTTAKSANESHSITITRKMQDGPMIARFFLRNESDVEELLIMIFGGYLAGMFEESVAKAFKDNNLGELYA